MGMRRKFRILFLGEPSSPNTVSWVEGLRDCGCDVKMASARTRGGEDIFPIGPSILAPRARMLAGIEDLRKIIRKTSPDILIAYRITSYGYIAAKASFKPLVLAAQNENIVFAPESSFFRRKMLGHFAKFAISRADLIHAWGDNIKKGLLGYGADPEKILVLHRGIDSSIFRPPNPDQKKYWQNTPIFLSTRSLEKEYLIDKLLVAFSIAIKEIPVAVLRIAGDGSEKNRLVRMAAELGISSKVEFIGKLKNSEIADELRKAHSYVSLIRTEGVSSSLIEACSCGIIPIVADIPASRELVIPGKNAILLADDSPETAARAMLESVRDFSLFRNALANSEITRAAYDRKRNIETFVRQYRKLAGFPPSGDIKIHICHITTSHAPEDTRIFQRECRSLCEKGYRVSLIARVMKKSVPYTHDGVDIIPIRYILGKAGRKLILPKIAVQRAVKLKADIYHFHDPELMPWMCIMAKNYPVKIVWDAHELYSATIKEFYIRNPGMLAAVVAKYYTRFERLWCANFSAVIAVSEPIRQVYENIGASNCVTVRNTIDLGMIPSPASQKDTHFSMIVSGTTNSSRCIVELIQAYRLAKKRIPKIRLNLIPHFDSQKDEDAIRARIENCPDCDGVRIVKPMPWKALMSVEVPKNHIGLVLYAKTENNCAGLPNRLFEYWALGLPVIATNTPLLKKIVEEEDAGLIVNSEDPSEIADAICRLAEDPARLARQSGNARRAVQERYNWNIDFAELSRLYDKILSGWRE